MTWIIKSRDNAYWRGTMWTQSQKKATRYPTKQSAKDVTWPSSINCRVVRLRTSKQRKEADRAALILYMEKRIAALEAQVDNLLGFTQRVSARVCLIEEDLGHPIPLQDSHGNLDHQVRQRVSHRRWSRIGIPKTRSQVPNTAGRRCRRRSLYPMVRRSRRSPAHTRGSPHRVAGGSAGYAARPDQQAGTGPRLTRTRLRRESLTWRRTWLPR